MSLFSITYAAITPSCKAIRYEPRTLNVFGSYGVLMASTESMWLLWGALGYLSVSATYDPTVSRYPCPTQFHENCLTWLLRDHFSEDVTVALGTSRVNDWLTCGSKNPDHFTNSGNATYQLYLLHNLQKM